MAIMRPNEPMQNEQAGSSIHKKRPSIGLKSGPKVRYTLSGCGVKRAGRRTSGGSRKPTQVVQPGDSYLALQLASSNQRSCPCGVGRGRCSSCRIRAEGTRRASKAASPSRCVGGILDSASRARHSLTRSSGAGRERRSFRRPRGTFVDQRIKWSYELPAIVVAKRDLPQRVYAIIDNLTRT